MLTLSPFVRLFCGVLVFVQSPRLTSQNLIEPRPFAFDTIWRLPRGVDSINHMKTFAPPLEQSSSNVLHIAQTRINPPRTFTASLLIYISNEPQIVLGANDCASTVKSQNLINLDNFVHLEPSSSVFDANSFGFEHGARTSSGDANPICDANTNCHDSVDFDLIIQQVVCVVRICVCACTTAILLMVPLGRNKDEKKENEMRHTRDAKGRRYITCTASSPSKPPLITRARQCSLQSSFSRVLLCVLLFVSGATVHSLCNVEIAIVLLTLAFITTLLSVTERTYRLSLVCVWFNCTGCKGTQYYTFISSPKKNWHDADAYCQETYGTHLATIWNDDAATELSTLSSNSFCMGLNDINSINWTYVDGNSNSLCGGNCGSNVEYKYWCPDEPNNAGGDEHCAAAAWCTMTNISSLLTDVGCDEVLSFACNNPITIDYYVFEASPMTWDDANAYCQQTYGTHLATIWHDDAAEELSMLTFSTDPFWIGLNDQNAEGIWTYADSTLCGVSCGSNAEYKYWYPNEPNNTRGSEDCALLGYYGFYDISKLLKGEGCDGVFPFACNKPNSYYLFEAVPMAWDDADEFCQQKYGTHLATIWHDDAARELLRFSGDSFWIGLNDQNSEGTWTYADGNADSLCGGSCGSNVEYKYWRPGEPNDWEYNEDCALLEYGFSDISNLLNDGKCNEEHQFACNKPSSMYYVVQSELMMNWTDAEAYCQSMYSTHLATIWDDNAAEELQTLCTYNTVCWTGINDLTATSTWEYVDGSTSSLCGANCISLPYWADDEPNPNPMYEHCVAIDGSGELRDYLCSQMKAFACNTLTTNDLSHTQATAHFYPTTYRVNPLHDFHPECDDLTVVLPAPTVPTQLDTLYQANGTDGWGGQGVAFTNAWVDAEGNITYESPLSVLVWKSWSSLSAYHVPSMVVQGTDHCFVNTQIAYLMDFDNRTQWKRIGTLPNAGAGDQNVFFAQFLDFDTNIGDLVVVNPNRKCNVLAPDTCSPTSAPTAAPSNAPSNHSNAPSSPPSHAPSFAPSNAPSNAPSSSPSHAPSFAPSTSPSHPSIPPSSAPSAAPSNAPSNAPSSVPSHAPSFAPTMGPTACLDLRSPHNNGTDDGTDEWDVTSS
eukprot:71081_1